MRGKLRHDLRVRIPFEMRQQLESMASRTRKDVSDVVREAIWKVIDAEASIQPAPEACESTR
jgi:predicted DNA-binding protein